MPLGGGGLTGSPGAVTHTLQADFSGTAFGGSPTWTDITGYWLSAGSDPGGSPATEPWGRQDQATTVESSTTSFVLNNSDGRFTPGKASSPYYPNVKRRVRMRHTIFDGTTTLTLEDGYVDSWTVTVQTNGPTLATVSLSDGFARLQVSTLLRSIAVEEALADAPSAFYPLDEAAGSTSAGDATGKNAAAAVKNSKYGAGTLTFGDATSIVGQSGAVSLSSPDYGSASLGVRATYLAVPNVVPTGAAFTVEAWFKSPTVAPGGDGAYLFRAAPIGGTFGKGDIFCEINPAGTLRWLVFLDTAGNVTPATSTTVCDGLWHHTALTFSGGTTVVMYLDGAVVQTVVETATTYSNVGRRFTLGVSVNDVSTTDPLDGSLALFGQYGAALTATRILAHYNAGKTAFSGESTSARFARLLTYRPNLGGTSTGTMGTVGSEDIGGQSLGDALTSVATAEGGVIQTNRGTLTLIGRSNWYDPAATLTLDASNGEVDLPTTWRDDTQGLVNDVTVSRPNGADQRAVNTASTTGADGTAQTSISANLNSDRDAADMAGWLVAVGVREQLDSPTLTVNLYARSSAALTMAVCALKTYDVVTLINLPASAPASTMTFQVQGGTYTVGADTFTAELYTTTMPPTVLRFDATADAYTTLDNGLVFAW